MKSDFSVSLCPFLMHGHKMDTELDNFQGIGFLTAVAKPTLSFPMSNSV